MISSEAIILPDLSAGVSGRILDTIKGRLSEPPDNVNPKTPDFLFMVTVLKNTQNCHLFY